MLFYSYNGGMKWNEIMTSNHKVEIKQRQNQYKITNIMKKSSIYSKMCRKQNGQIRRQLKIV